MLKKISELEFYKLFGLIAAYFSVFYLGYRFLLWFSYGDEFVYLLEIASVVITAVLFLALFKMRKRKK